MSGSRLSGLSAGAYRLIAFPSLPTRNFVKFHLIASVPSIPGRALFEVFVQGMGVRPVDLDFCEHGETNAIRNGAKRLDLGLGTRNALHCNALQ